MREFRVGEFVTIDVDGRCESLKHYQGRSATVTSVYDFLVSIKFDDDSSLDQWHKDWVRHEDPFVRFVKKVRREAGIENGT